MELIWLLTTLLCVGFAWYAASVSGRLLYPTAPNWFLFVNGMLLVGTLSIADPARDVDLLYVAIQVVGMLCFFVGAWLCNAALRTNPGKAYRRFKAKPLQFDLQGRVISFAVAPVTLVSLLVMVAFAIAFGDHVLISTFRLSVAGTAENLSRSYSSARTDVHYGGRYLYIGYVQQFKDFLLPASTALLFVRAAMTNRRVHWAVVALLIPVNVYFLTITGQRSPLLMFALALFLLASERYGKQLLGLRHGSTMRVWGRSLAALAMLLFVATSFFRGYVSTSASPLELLLSPVEQLWWRVGPGLAEAKLQVMSVIFDRPITWGADWASALASIMPGHEIGLSNQLHEMLYGSDRGSVGLQAWESLWYNFGWAGILAGGILLGFLLQWFTIRSFQGSRTTSRVTLFAIMALWLGNYTDPYGLFNGGVVALGLYYLMIRIAKGTRPRPGQMAADSFDATFARLPRDSAQASPNVVRLR